MEAPRAQGTWFVTGGDGRTVARCTSALGRPPVDSTSEIATWLLDETEAERAAAALARRVDRHFDRFQLLPPPDRAGRARLVHAFFAWLARDYDSVTDGDRNAANIRALHELLRAHGVPEEARLLDFGCGTGLGARVLDAAPLVGFDQCETMRAIAARGPGTVWGPDDLDRQRPGCLDAGFASYVLHLRTGAELVRRALERLRGGAVFAANFHHDAGIVWASAIFRSARMHAVHETDGGPHGRLVVYEKQPTRG